MLVWKRSRELAEGEDARCDMRATKMSWAWCAAAFMGVFFAGSWMVSQSVGVSRLVVKAPVSFL